MKKLLCVLMFGMVFGQAELTTRVYTIPLDMEGGGSTYDIDIPSITGYELDNATVEFFSIDNYVVSPDGTEGDGIWQPGDNWVDVDGDGLANASADDWVNCFFDGLIHC